MVGEIDDGGMKMADGAAGDAELVPAEPTAGDEPRVDGIVPLVDVTHLRGMRRGTVRQMLRPGYDAQTRTPS